MHDFPSYSRAPLQNYENQGFEKNNGTKKNVKGRKPEVAESMIPKGKSCVSPAPEREKAGTLPILAREHDVKVPGNPFCHPWQNP